MHKRKFDLDQRLVSFSVSVINLAENLPRTFAGIHLAKQLIRSGTSPALNYGEAQGAESRKDFVHKLRIVLKELRETFMGLRVIQEKFSNCRAHEVSALISETDELISIVYRSIMTAERNQKK